MAFAGKQVEQDARLLMGDWGLREGRFAGKYGDKSHKCKGLKASAMEFLHEHMDKSKDVTPSRLDVRQVINLATLKSSFRLAFARHAAAVDEGLLTSMPDLMHAEAREQLARLLDF